MLNLRCELWSPGGIGDSSKGLRLDTQEGGGVPTGNVHGGWFGGLANGLQGSVSHLWGRGVTWCMLLVLPCTAAEVGHCKREPHIGMHHWHHRHICSDHFLRVGSKELGGGHIWF